ncbi:hypothetical protein F4802DRAFT_568975 [Xylaria palmicola]|nr:hypothetical protein F4802DRAFT_568975 [Xylaria palmicola]
MEQEPNASPHPLPMMTGPSLARTIQELTTSKGNDHNELLLSPTIMPLSDDSKTDSFRCEVQTLYEGPPKCKCCKNWVEEYPDDLRTAVEEQPDVKQKALVVRMRKNHGDGKPLVLDSIVVQSPSLKETLSEVFDGYDGITASLKKLVFKSPFRPFYYRWERLKQILERQKRETPDAAAFTQLLYDVLYAELHDVIVEVRDHLEHQVITYPLLWAILEPGKVVCGEVDGDDRFFIVDSCRYSDRHYAMAAVNFIDWDGSRFGYASHDIVICEFDGTRKINDLEVFPVEFHSSGEESEKLAISRALRFQKLCGIHYMAHSGFVKRQVDNRSVKQNVDGRIVVDAVSYFRSNPSSQLKLAALGTESFAPKIKVAEEAHIDEYPPFRCGNGYMQEAAFEAKLRKRKLESGELPLTKRPKSETIPDLTRDQLLLCHSMVRGYSLMLKAWVEFKIGDIFDITWNDDAFPSLMLPKGFKNLVLSFAEGQTANEVVFDDVIKGKGMGIIMLLVGNPGTGKTLTAEAVADKVRKPLYTLSAGELGQSASDVEETLTEVLNLTEKWGAVLLFDECDVFIQERTTTGLAHNEIVAVFLRMLEYYRGILFMTSNRADTIDRAFHSRIHLTLHYPDLELDARAQIWRQFTRQSRSDTCLTNEDINNLAGLPLNGRQIKNVVKISTLLAGQEKVALGLDHIRTVLDATEQVKTNQDS